MFAQIFLGIFMIARAVIKWIKPHAFINTGIRQNVSKHQLASYQRGQGLPLFLLGVLFISMGIIEKKDILQTSVFVAIYILLALTLLGLLLLNNKKYSGRY